MIRGMPPIYLLPVECFAAPITSFPGYIPFSELFHKVVFLFMYMYGLQMCELVVARSRQKYLNALKVLRGLTAYEFAAYSI